MEGAGNVQPQACSTRRLRDEDRDIDVDQRSRESRAIHDRVECLNILDHYEALVGPSEEQTGGGDG